MLMKRKIGKRVFAVLMTLLLVMLSGTFTAALADDAGKTIYVSPAGDDNNAGTEAMPLKTIAKANAIVNAGDTVILMEGNYVGTIRPMNKGTAEAPITYKNANGKSATICKGQALINLTDEEEEQLESDLYALYLYDNSYVTIDGINFDFTSTEGGDHSRWGRIVNSSNITLKNITFNHTTVPGSSGSVMFINSHYNTITGCTFEDGNDNLVLVQSDYNLVDDCTFIKGRHALWCIRAGSYNIIRNCYFHNDIQKIGEIYDNGAWSASQYGTIAQDAAKHNIVENNIFAYTPHDPEEVGGPYNGLQFAGQDCIIRNNVFYDNSGGGLSLTIYADEANYNYNNRIYNNTFVNNEGGGISITSKDEMSTDYVFYNNVIKNNIISNNIYTEPGKRHNYADWVALRGKPVQIWGGVRMNGFMMVNNVIYASDLDYAVASGDNSEHYSIAWLEENRSYLYSRNITNIEPEFVKLDAGYDKATPNAANHDFALKEGSPLIDKGEFLTTVIAMKAANGRDGDSSGTGNKIAVNDPFYFSDGFGITEGDTIKLQNGQKAVITNIKYGIEHNIITLDRDISWNKGIGVSLDYEGAAPDMGAVETKERASTTPLDTPIEFVTDVSVSEDNKWNDGSDWFGMKLTVGSSDIVIKQLGRYMVAGNNREHELAIFEPGADPSTASSTKLASVTVNMAGHTVGEFVYAELPAPVTLEAGKEYYIASYEEKATAENVTDFWYGSKTVVAHTADAISVAVRTRTPSSTGINRWEAGSGTNNCLGPVSFIYEIPSQTVGSVGGSVAGIQLDTPTEFISDVSVSEDNKWNDGSDWFGMKLIIGSSDIVIKQLGRYMVAGNNREHELAIFEPGADPSTASSTKLASVTVNMAGHTVGEFVYAELPAPVMLEAGKEYYIASYEEMATAENVTDFWYGSKTVVTHTADAISVAVRTRTPSSTGINRWEAGSGANNCLGPVSFIYEIPSQTVVLAPIEETVSAAQAAQYALSIAAPQNGQIVICPDKPAYNAGETVRLLSRPANGYQLDKWSGDASGSNLVAEIVMDADKAVSAEFTAWSAPQGIPTPAFGITQTYRMYDNAANRNSALTYNESADGGFYTHYVDSTAANAADDANEFGTILNPRKTLPAIIPEGSVVELHGGTYGGTTINALGTEAKPAFVRGFLGVEAVISGDGLILNSQYAIFENLKIMNAPVTITSLENVQAQSVVVRNCEILRGVNVVSELKELPVIDTVIYNNYIHADEVNPLTGEVSEETSTRGVDLGKNIDRTWVLDNLITTTKDDAVHAGDESEYDCTNSYIGRNIMHSGAAAGVFMADVDVAIISENAVFNFKATQDSIAAVCRRYDNSRSGKNIWFIYNDMFDCGLGIQFASRQKEDVFIVGNVIRDIKKDDGTGYGFNAWNARKTYIVDNVFHNVDVGVNWGVDDTYNADTQLILEGNIIVDVMSGAHLLISDREQQVKAVVNNNLFHQSEGDILIRRGSNHYNSLAAWNDASNDKGATCIEGDPMFVDAANNDFRLQANSPAIDSGAVSSVYQKFFDDFGIDIQADKDGLSRPQGGAWDIGAYEYK